MLIPMILIVIFYPLITNPLVIFMANKNLDKAIKQYIAEQAEEEEDEE